MRSRLQGKHLKDYDAGPKPRFGTAVSPAKMSGVGAKSIRPPANTGGGELREKNYERRTTPPSVRNDRYKMYSPANNNHTQFGAATSGIFANSFRSANLNLMARNDRPEDLQFSPAKLEAHYKPYGMPELSKDGDITCLAQDSISPMAQGTLQDKPSPILFAKKDEGGTTFSQTHQANNRFARPDESTNANRYVSSSGNQMQKWRSKRVETLRSVPMQDEDIASTGHDLRSTEIAEEGSLDRDLTDPPKQDLNHHQWWYKDPTGVVQGPFDTNKMRDWHKQGFFKNDLPIRCKDNTPFVPLGDWFKAGFPAFLDKVPEDWQTLEEIPDPTTADAHDGSDSLVKSPGSVNINGQLRQGLTDDNQPDNNGSLWQGGSAATIQTPSQTSWSSWNKPNDHTSTHTARSTFETLNWPQPVAEKLVQPETTRSLHESAHDPINAPLRTQNSIVGSPTNVIDPTMRTSSLTNLQNGTGAVQHGPIGPTPQRTKAPNLAEELRSQKRVETIKQCPAPVQKQHAHNTPTQTQRSAHPFRNGGNSYAMSWSQRTKPVQDQNSRGFGEPQRIVAPENVMRGRTQQRSPIGHGRVVQQQHAIVNNDNNVLKKSNQPWEQQKHTKKEKSHPVVKQRAGKKEKPRSSKKIGEKDSYILKGTKEESNGSSVQATKDNPFGGQKMSKEFDQWCRTQMKQLRGISDQGEVPMELVKYLMSLTAEEEIRDTIKYYLGDNQKVRNFADGFLVRKDFDHENLNRKPKRRSGRK